ncbi:MAG: PAS domain-containing sensor histidine kinase [Candidatus Methanoperedens sp.]|nr:PAS domain-containing sensor histidine kinase [Candidatus Methanoperedens sp.]CAG1008905.1 two-component system, OmpR family, phosphate regulon sensor histidine kinase PhoR [Methanosarcinales archaeon]
MGEEDTGRFRECCGGMKKLEISLKDSEEKYRDLFENAQDPMYTIDLNGTFLEMNKAGIKGLGATKDEIIGSNLSRWLTPESMETARNRLAKYTKGPPSGSMAYEMIRKDGTHIWVEIKNRCIKEDGKLTIIHGIARDITEKIRLEQKLKYYHEQLERSYEELLEADNVKTEFISNITHELLTPLTSIRGFVELLEDETMGKINAEQKKSLEIILRNCDRLIKLIKELLDTSNLENNKLGFQFGLVSLNSILSKTIHDIHPQANDKQITIIKDIQQLPEIWGDEERLVQVLMNLLINAIKFTPHKGKITIKAKADIEHINISISDTGIGIAPDKLNSIFDRFYQVDGSARRKYGGVGIGLSICRSIIDKHFGKIWAQSDGKGSTFHIVLPKLKYKSGEDYV